MKEAEIERQVRIEIEAYCKERKLDKERQEALWFDRVRLARMVLWLEDLKLQDQQVLDLGTPTLATHIIKKWFPNNTVDNTDFDLRTRFPYKDASYDLIINTEVIEHIFDLQSLHSTTLSGVTHVLAECFRVLKAGGRMLLTTPNASSIWIIQRALLHQPPLLYEYHFREFTFSEIVALVKQAGFQMEKAITEKVWHFWNFGPIEEFMHKEGYSLENRGDDTFLLARKR